MSAELRIEVITRESLSEDVRKAIVDLCSRAFWEDYEALMKPLKHTTHLLGYYNDSLVSHALWVTRWLQIGDGPMLRTAYIEGVATDQEFRGKGFASAMMTRLVAEVKEFDFAALSPFSVAYYARLGWELWHGPLYIRSEEGIVRTLRDGDVMIFRLPKTPKLDVNAPLSAEWREGDLW